MNNWNYQNWHKKKYKIWLALCIQEKLNSQLIAMIKQKTPGSDGLNNECYQIHKEKIQTILHNLLQKIRGRNMSQLILWGQHNTDTKTKQEQFLEKLHAIITH